MSANHCVMIVSPDADLIERLSVGLRQDRWEVLVATSTRDARAMCHEHPVPLVVADVRTEDMNPALFMAAICQSRRQTRFIVLVHRGQTAEVLRAAHSPVLAVFNHPCRVEDILAQVHSHFQSLGSGVNRRAHTRHVLPAQAQCILINPYSGIEEEPIATLMRDVSRSGISLLLRRLVPVPSMIRLVSHLSDETRPLSMLAKTVSCTLTQIPGIYRLGAKFVGLLPPEVEEVIAERGRGATNRELDDPEAPLPLQEAIVTWLRNLPEEEKANSLSIDEVNRLARELAQEGMEVFMHKAAKAGPDLAC